MKKINIYYIVLTCLIHSAILPSQTTNKPDKWITILTHGSFSLRPHLNLSNIMKMLNDSIEESIYYRSTEINRRDPFFYKNQAMSHIGLHKIDTQHLTNTTAAPIIAKAFEQVSQISNYPASDEYYTFGWSGLVSNKLRYLEADFMYRELINVIKHTKEQGFNPKIRLIGYSHGGNLALQLGAIHQTKPKYDKITIDELHLLGTPIQVETDYLITSPIFEKVYNYYSDADKVQTLDFFSFKRFFSQRRFIKRKNFTLPDKLTQVNLRVTDYQKRKRKKAIPENLPEHKRHKYYKVLRYDPGHFELWFMGWTILTFRKEFPTNPLPILVFIPLITKYIQEHPELGNDVIANIVPSDNHIELSAYRTKINKNKTVQPFVQPDILRAMQQEALQYVPDNYNLETYNRKVYDAINIVTDEIKEIDKITKQEKKQAGKNSDPVSINLHKPEKSYQGHLATKKFSDVD